MMGARLQAWLRRPGTFILDRRGAGAIEFGLTAPIVILVLLGTVDFGRAMWTATTLARAASDTTRYAAVRGAEKSAPATSTEIQAYARDQAIGLDPNTMNVQVTWSPNNSAGSAVTVRVSYPFEFMLVGFLPIAPITFERQSTLTIS